MNPQTLKAIQAAIDADPAVDEAVLLKGGQPVGDVKAAHAPPPPPPPPPPKPPIKVVTQVHNQWYQQGNPGPTNIANLCITDGGLINLNAQVNASQIVTLTNVYNQKGPDIGGMYFALLWPPGDANTQQAIPKLVWDNTGCNGIVHQGQWETAFRAKCDDATVIGVVFQAFLDSNGNPVKQVVEIRHGKSWVFRKCTFKDGWADLGAQQVAMPDGSSQTVMSQKIGTVLFDQCTFTRAAPGGKVWHRAPNVGKIIATNCIGPDGKTFSLTE